MIVNQLVNDGELAIMGVICQKNENATSISKVLWEIWDWESIAPQGFPTLPMGLGVKPRSQERHGLRSQP